MRSLWKKLTSLLDYVRSWKKEINMPGVADQVRRTQLIQEQRRRKKDMEELVRMVKEDRLHEADERQLETLRIVTELQKAFEGEVAPVGVPQDLLEAVREVVVDAVSKLPAPTVAVRPQDDPDRPTMKHVSLDLSQDGTDLQVSHGEELGKEEESTDDAKEQLNKLREIKRKK
jgi:hypothetical protein